LVTISTMRTASPCGPTLRASHTSRIVVHVHVHVHDDVYVHDDGEISEEDRSLLLK
jgi:hypothetical protein